MARREERQEAQGTLVEPLLPKAPRRKVERLFAWVGNFRRLVVRYAYHAANYRNGSFQRLLVYPGKHDLGQFWDRLERLLSDFQPSVAQPSFVEPNTTSAIRLLGHIRKPENSIVPGNIFDDRRTMANEFFEISCKPQGRTFRLYVIRHESSPSSSNR